MSKLNPALLAFGRNIRKRRDAIKLTQEALAERANLDRTYISGVERGLRNVSILNILSIAKGLDTTMAELSKGISL